MERERKWVREREPGRMRKVCIQVVSVLLLTLMIWSGNPYAADAAAKPFESGYLRPVSTYSDYKTKLAGKYFWVDEYGGNIYYAGSKNGKGKKLVASVEGLDEEVVTNGQNLIYTVVNARTGYTDVYQVNIKNGKKKNLGRYETKGQFSNRVLVGYYGGKVIISDYITLGRGENPNIILYNLKNGKSRRIGDYSSPNQYGSYLFMTSSERHFLTLQLYAYHLPTGRKVTISNCCGACEIVNGELYFTEEKGTSMVIKKCSLSGKKKKTLTGKLKLNDTMGYIHSCALGKTYAIYSKGGNDEGWYKITYKTKKISKSSRNAFDKLRSQGIRIY